MAKPANHGISYETLYSEGSTVPSEIFTPNGLTLLQQSPSHRYLARSLHDLIQGSASDIDVHGEKISGKYTDLSDVEAMFDRPNAIQSYRYLILQKGILSGFIKATQNLWTEYEVGYWLGSEARGKGSASSSTRTLTHFLLNKQRRVPVDVVAYTDPANAASQAVLESAHFDMMPDLVDGRLEYVADRDFYVPDEK